MKYFQNVILLSLLLVGGLSVFTQEALAAKKATFKGRVTTTNNEGVVGVVVSDGYQVTTTDSKGNYTLKGSDSAKFVFISIPSEYEIPATGGMPQFYFPVKGKKKATANFQLVPKKKDYKFVLTVMADPQMQKPVDMKRFLTEAIPDFSDIQQYYPTNTTFIGMTAGDNTWDAPKLYPNYVEGLETVSYPWFQVIGNHDHDQKVTDNDYEASHNFEKNLGPAYYSFNRGDCHFIALDNILYGTRKKYQTTITQYQLDWLKQDLKHVSTDKLLIIGMHSPFKTRTNKRLLTNARELLDILDGYQVVFITGHTHRMNKEQITDKVVDYTLSATMGNTWAADVSPDGTPLGYGVFEIEGNKLVKQYYKSLQKDPSYQLVLFPTGSVQDKEESVVAHVWNYNKAWKVEVYEDNTLKGEMKQFTGFDPVAYELYIGPDKPVRRPKLEPATSRHLFYYTPESTNSTIKVVATDDFGNQFTKTLQQNK